MWLIKHSRQCFIGYPNTSNFVKNTPLRVVFSILFSVPGYPDETLSLVFDISHQIKMERLLLALLNRKEPFVIGSSKWQRDRPQFTGTEHNFLADKVNQ